MKSNEINETLAFQKMVTQMAFPDYDVKAWLIMPDKSKKNNNFIPNLNQLLNEDDNDHHHSSSSFQKLKHLIHQSDQIESLLTEVCVDDIIEDFILQPEKNVAPLLNPGSNSSKDKKTFRITQ